MAGKVLEVLVEVGAAVAEDTDLLLLESMKMEIPIQAPCAGTVIQVPVRPGDIVRAGDVLLTLQ